MRVVTILINERCPLRCRHCSVGFSESYSGSGYKMDSDSLVSTIEAIDPRVYGMVVFGGGEPSLEPQLLRIGIDACQQAGLHSGIVTAPIWASTPATAVKFLDKVQGLTNLILSYDYYHLDFLKFSHYENAVLEAVRRGILINVNMTYGDESEIQPLLDSLAPLRSSILHVSTTRAVPIGNAAQKGNVNVQFVTITQVEDLERVPRTCLIGHAYVDGQRRVHGCCYSSIGESSPFSSLAGVPAKVAFPQMEANPAFQAVLKRGFIDSLSQHGKELLFEQVRGLQFAVECDLCVAAMSKRCKPVWDDYGS